MTRQSLGPTMTPAGALADRPRGFEPIAAVIERVLEPILARSTDHPPREDARPAEDRPGCP